MKSLILIMAMFSGAASYAAEATVKSAADANYIEPCYEAYGLGWSQVYMPSSGLTVCMYSYDVHQSQLFDEKMNSKKTAPVKTDETL